MTKFLASIFPISGNLNFKLTHSASISQTDCHLTTEKDHFQVDSYIKGNQQLRDTVLSFAKQKADVYFAYELWQSKKVSLNAESGTDIATGVQVSATGPLSSGEGNVNYTKATKEKIDIDAATPVNFALRLVRLDVDFRTQAITANWLGSGPPGMVSRRRGEGEPLVISHSPVSIKEAEQMLSLN